MLVAALGCGVAVLAVAPSAFADDWLPHPSDATWTYEWTDSTYNTTPTAEMAQLAGQRR